MFIATACFVGMSTFVKILREDGLETSEVVFWRSAPGLVWVWVELRLRKTPLRPNAPRPLVWRSFAGLAAMSAYFYALRALTMTESAVLHLLQPVFVALLAPFMLDERLRRHAIVALVLAVLGALIVIRPDRAWRAELPTLALLAGLCGALSSAFAHVMVRRATAKDAPELVVFWFTVCVTSAGLVLSLASGRMLTGLPAGADFLETGAKIAAMAALGLAGQLTMTRAYSRAAAPMVAIVAYASIPLSFAIDLFSWEIAPSMEIVLGSLLMVVAGVLLVRGRGA